MKTAIFDIDGTLANLSHRLHLLPNYDAFFAQAGGDIAIWPMVNLAIKLYDCDYQIILVSGRTDRIRKETENWLDHHGIKYAELYMRPDGDYRKDYIIKKEILAQIHKDFDNLDIQFVVDDRSSVVRMWREEGLICLQCAEWEEVGHKIPLKKGLLTLMVGPSGAGKSTWLYNAIEGGNKYGILRGHIISSDELREDLCGDFRDQSKNAEVFAAVHAIAKTRIAHGLPCVIDATHIKRADRLASMACADGGPVRYIEKWW
jgi:AAA domain-containing protein